MTLKRLFKHGILLLGVLGFILLMIMPAPKDLSIQGQRALGVFILCLSLWITGYLPLAITSIMGIGMIPLLGIMSPEEAFALFGNKAIFFILGALMLAAALYKTGLGSRIAFALVIHFDHQPPRIIAGIIIASAFLSCIMPEHAVAAMLFPIILEIARSLKLQPLHSNFGKALFISMAWGTVIGGITTFLGGARNLLAVGVLEENYGLTVGFFEWIKYSFPFTIILLVIAYWLILKAFPPEIESAEAAIDEMKNRIKELGPLQKNEKLLLWVLILVIFSWLFLSSYIHISVTAVLGGVLIFILNVIDWKDIEDYINWGVILMYGGAIVVATALTQSGAAGWFARQVFEYIPLSPLIFLLSFSLLTKFLTEGISNVAAVAIVIPLAFSVGGLVNINPVVTTLLIALTGGLAFCLPMGAPPNAIAFSSGYLKLTEILKPGLILNIIAVLLIYLIARIYWPLVGLKMFM